MAFISALCSVAPGGGKLLCSEKVTVLATTEGARHVPALVRALRVPDVPTALFWTGAPPGRGDDPGVLCDRVDRLIVDTGRAARADGEVDLAGLFWTASLGVEVADLGWLRLRPFRTLFASFFDQPVGAEPLRRAVRVRVDAAKHAGGTAGMLLGWLATQLGWGPAEKARREKHETATRAWSCARPGGGFVHLEVLLREVDAGRDGIHEVLLESEGGGRFSITDVGPSQIELRGTGLPVRVVGAPEREDAELLTAALGSRGADPTFVPALERAAGMWR
jgi:glucose-6-phosphate dehydrogenase assembly protein OpcA